MLSWIAICVQDSFIHQIVQLSKMEITGIVEQKGLGFWKWVHKLSTNPSFMHQSLIPLERWLGLVTRF